MKRKITMLAALVAIVTIGQGCAQYSAQKWTPDSFNYTLQRDRETGDISDYWGASWNLKP
jgi:hypothetical protein